MICWPFCPCHPYLHTDASMGVEYAPPQFFLKIWTVMPLSNSLSQLSLLNWCCPYTLIEQTLGTMNLTSHSRYVVARWYGKQNRRSDSLVEKRVVSQQLNARKGLETNGSRKGDSWSPEAWCGLLIHLLFSICCFICLLIFLWIYISSTVELLYIFYILFHITLI